MQKNYCSIKPNSILFLCMATAKHRQCVYYDPDLAFLDGNCIWYAENHCTSKLAQLSAVQEREDQMSSNKRVNAIMSSLRMSVKSGLNASLTPEDCGILLALFSRYKLPQRPPIKQLDTLLDKLTNLASEAIDAIGDDIQKGR